MKNGKSKLVTWPCQVEIGIVANKLVKCFTKFESIWMVDIFWFMQESICSQ